MGQFSYTRELEPNLSISSTATTLALSYWDWQSTHAERMCADILRLDGFGDVQPQAPSGGPDGGKDILCERNGLSFVVACYFPRRPTSFSAIKRKFIADLIASMPHGTDGFIFMTNQSLTLGQRANLEQLIKEEFSESKIYTMEILRLILDSSAGVVIRSRYLNIEATREESIAHIGSVVNALVMSSNAASESTKVKRIDSASAQARENGRPERSLRLLEDENAKLRMLLADAHLEIANLREQRDALPLWRKDM